MRKWYDLWQNIMTKEDYNLITKGFSDKEKDAFDLAFYDTNSKMSLDAGGLLTFKKRWECATEEQRDNLIKKQNERRKRALKHVVQHFREYCKRRALRPITEKDKVYY